ncbi:hypothetical protein Tco_0876814 [Tanacetum coccineum]|uniref:Uncharacterized protein n=1 Tax=Tanacetum coccineum TaxID=301880 RepID=A0ABQ5BWT5_9ASTR
MRYTTTGAENPTAVDKIRPSRNDKEREIEWLDVEEPLDLFDTIKFAEITNRNLRTGIFEEKKKNFFADPGDGVRINHDGVARPAIGKFDFI